MPWLTIIMALLGFLSSMKASNGNTARSLAVGALAGGATYYTTHEIEWGKENLGFLDGAVDASGVAVAPGEGNVPSDPTSTTKVPEIGAGKAGFWANTGEVLKSWGPTGTAMVVGAAGVASGSTNWLLWGGIALGAFLIFKG